MSEPTLADIKVLIEERLFDAEDAIQQRDGIIASLRQAVADVNANIRTANEVLDREREHRRSVQEELRQAAAKITELEADKVTLLALRATAADLEFGGELASFRQNNRFLEWQIEYLLDKIRRLEGEAPSDPEPDEAAP